MAIVNNTSSEIGDEILIQATTPIFGVIQLQSFTDILVGETATRYFEKHFTYSIDGIFFSDWIELTDDNLLEIVVNSNDAFYINYRYKRVGSDPSGLLEFKKVCLLGQFVEPICENYFILPNSIFKDFFCANPQHSMLCSVLTNKMFEKGILPEYITRNQTETPKVDDKDFLEFWGTVSCFFALQLMLAKKLENFDSYLDTLQDFLEQRDIKFCKAGSDLEDLQYIKSNYFDEIRQRGTWNIFEMKGFENKPVNGEFLRLICKSDCDEFWWELITDQNMGWWLGTASPMYKGSSFSNQINHGGEPTKNFLDLNKYTTFKDNGGDITLIADAEKNVAKIANVPDGQIAGFAINPDINIPPNLENAITIDENVDYEITFWIKTDIVVDNISFGVNGYDCDENIVFPRSSVDDSTSNFFFTKEGLNKANTWYFVRGILYNKNSQTLTPEEALLNIGFGKTLKSFTNMQKIVPYIVLDRENNPNVLSSLFIWDLKVRPLVKGAVANTVYNDLNFVPDYFNEVSFGSFATGFLTAKNLLHVAYENKNAEKTNDEIFEIARHKLIPYNSTLITTELTPVPPPTPVDFGEFDFMIVKYRWFTYSGYDLDTRTTIEGTLDPAVDNQFVGWARGDIAPGGRRIIGDPLEPYLTWGGDNTSLAGEEHVLVDFKKLAEDYPLITDFFASVRAFWFSTRNAGNVEIEFETYLGGTMNPIGKTFENVGGQIVNKSIWEDVVDARRIDFPPPAANIEDEEVGKIKYNIFTRKAEFIPF